MSTAPADSPIADVRRAVAVAHDQGLLRSLLGHLRGRPAPGLPPADRRAGAGADQAVRRRPGRVRGRLRHRPAAARGGPGGPQGGGAGSVARDAGRRPATRGLQVVQGSLTAVPLPDAVVRSGLQHEGAGPRAAHPRGGGRADPAGAGRAATCCWSSTTRIRSGRWPSGWAGPGKIAAGTNESHVFTRYDTVAQARSYLPDERRVRWGCAGCGW